MPSNQNEQLIQRNDLPAVQGQNASIEADADAIDLEALFFSMLAHWKIIASCVLLCTVLMGVYTFRFATPLYEATSTIYVLSRDDSAINLSDLQIGTQLTNDYIKVFNMWEVHEQVISNLDLPYTYSQMQSMLKVSNTSNTRMLDITFTCPSAAMAAKVANEYAAVVSKYIADTMAMEQPHLMSSALVPGNPVSPKKMRNMALGILIGLAIGVAITVFLYLRDDKYKTSADVQKYTGMNVMAVVPENEPEKDRRSTKVSFPPIEYGINVFKLPQLSYGCNEAINTFCTNLSFSGSNVKKVMFTSSHASEGKSFAIMSTFMTLCALGKKVCLVDADIRRSVMVSTFGMQFTDPEHTVGLTHMLAGYANEPDVIYPTNLPGGAIVPAGRNVSNSLPLLTSERFNALLNHLAEHFDYVLVDSAPVGTIIDAAEIAKSCDGVVIVVNYNKVRRRELIEVQHQIMQTGCPILGAILNEVKMDSYINKNYYYKSYYDHYTEYSNDGNGNKEHSKTHKKK